MLILWLILIVISLLVFMILYPYWRDKRYFESRGIHFGGNAITNILLSNWKGHDFAQNIKSQYTDLKQKGFKVAGVNQFGSLSLLLLDVDLVKQICIKDVEHFVDRRTFEAFANDKITSKMLVTTCGDQWKSLRSKLSPTFTTGKIKRMFTIFDTSAKKLMTYIDYRMSKGGQLDILDGYAKLTMDVIANAACGIDSKAFDHLDTESEFEKMGLSMQMKFGGWRLLSFTIMVMFPKLAEIFGMNFFGKEAPKFFSRVIKEGIKYREERGEMREDFIQLLLEARKGLLKTDEAELDRFEKEAMISEGKGSAKDLLDDDSIVANCVLFIFAGFDTTQSLLIFAAYALALHQDKQEILRKETETALEETGDGEFTYDVVSKLSYLDMFLNETLRVYPPAVATDRGCTQDYKVPGTDFVLKKGQSVAIPIIGFHYDPEYFPEPTKFEPERFSAENKSKMNPYSFMPFGMGPRNCIGMRFALMEVKLAIAHLVKNFNIQPTEKTTIPMKYQSTASLKPVGGMWLAFNRR